jgi:bifunctional DNA-binding transcriptional regulator/antitoxin component of YhaV-PrlF toxin-antitoxin module
MTDFFRVRIGAKRQVTLPQLFLDRALLKEGDELEFEVNEGKIFSVRALKLVPLDYFDAETLSVLKQRVAQLEAKKNEEARASSEGVISARVKSEDMQMNESAPEEKTKRALYR